MNFNRWDKIESDSLDVVSNLILTGKRAKEANPDVWIYNHIGLPTEEKHVLDFGCGFGRNAFGMAKFSPMWKILGYDNPVMLSKTMDYFNVYYTNTVPFPNINFEFDWGIVNSYKFDVIICTLVLQHIDPKDLQLYLEDFKKMTKKLVVHGRMSNDFSKDSTWQIIENNGLIPNIFFSGLNQIKYKNKGDREEHNTGIYFL